MKKYIRVGFVVIVAAMLFTGFSGDVHAQMVEQYTSVTPSNPPVLPGDQYYNFIVPAGTSRVFSFAQQTNATSTAYVGKAQIMRLGDGVYANIRGIVPVAVSPVSPASSYGDTADNFFIPQGGRRTFSFVVTATSTTLYVLGGQGTYSDIVTVSVLTVRQILPGQVGEGKIVANSSSPFNNMAALPYCDSSIVEAVGATCGFSNSFGGIFATTTEFVLPISFVGKYGYTRSFHLTTWSYIGYQIQDTASSTITAYPVVVPTGQIVSQLDPSSPVTRTISLSPSVATDNIVLGVFDLKSQGRDATLQTLKIWSWVSTTTPSTVFSIIKIKVAGTTYTADATLPILVRGYLHGESTFNNLNIALPADQFVPVIVYGKVAADPIGRWNGLYGVVGLNSVSTTTYAYYSDNTRVPVRDTTSWSSTFNFASSALKTITLNRSILTSSYHVGDIVPIRWTSTNVSNVNINLMNYKGTTIVRPIASSSASVGQYNWTIPSDIDFNYDTIYTLAVSDASAANVVSKSGKIEILPRLSTTTPTITVTSPRANEMWPIAPRVTDTISGNESYRRDISWTGVSDSPEINDSTLGVRAYLEQYTYGTYTTIGRIPPFAYGSIAWVSGLVGQTNCTFTAGDQSSSCYNLSQMRVVPAGTYYIRLVDARTGAWGRSSAFLLASSSPLVTVGNQSTSFSPLPNPYGVVSGSMSMSFTLTAGDNPIYISKTLSSIMMTAPIGTAVNMSSVTAEPATVAGDATNSYVIPAGTTRRFTYGGFIDNTNGTTGVKEIKIVSIMYGLTAANSSAYQISSGLEALKIVQTMNSGSPNTSTPTASITASGQHSYTYTVGQTNHIVWSGTNGTSYSSYSRANDPAKCGEGAWVANNAQGSSDTYLDTRWAGCIWTITYVAKNTTTGVSASDTVTVSVVSSSPQPTTPPPTATFTVEGQHSYTYTPGQTNHYVWSSTNADSFSSYYTSSGPSVCGGGPWVANTASGQSSTYLSTTYAGCVWTITYTAKNSATGVSASDTIVVSVSSAPTPVPPPTTPVPTTPVPTQTKSLLLKSLGSSYKVGDSVPISWSSTGVNTVAIDLYDYKGLTKVKSIATVNAAGASYSWTVPADIDFNSDTIYTIRISDADQPTLYGKSPKIELLPATTASVGTPSYVAAIINALIRTFSAQ